MSSKNSSPNVCVVVPNWNGEDLIGPCLESLELQSEPCQIVVVDNGSTDGSLKKIGSDFPKIKLIKLKDNTGFAGGVNRGIEYALERGAEFIALFNNDAVADKNWLKELVAAAKESDKAGIVTGKFMRDDRIHLDSTGEQLSIWGLPFPRGRNQKDTGQYDKSEKIFGASGGASLYRAELFKQVGLFDEDYFAYYEDVDISFRAQMDGWKILYIPTAKAYHGVGGTSSKMGDFARYHSTKNFLLLYARNMPTRLYLKYLVLFALQFCRMILTATAKGKFVVFSRATWAAIKLHGATRKARKENLSKQKVSTSYIDSILTHSRPPRIPRLHV